MAVFGLKKIYLNQVENNYENYDQVTVSSYGYLSGGFTPSTISDVERIDYSNDTISDSVRSLTNGYAGPTGSKNLGDGSDNYIYGGFPSPVNGSRISRFTYANETFQNSTQNLPTDVGYMAQTSNRQYAFLGGGQSTAQSPSTINTIYRMSFSDETLSAPGTNLTSSKRGVVGFSNNSFGYYANGFDPSSINTCNIDRLTFSDGTISAHSFTQKGSGYSSVCSTPQYAYIAGGYSASDVNNISSVQRYDFSASTTSTTPFLLQTDKEGSTSLESSTTGYFGGGYQRPGGIISSGERIDFSNETVSNLQNLKSGRGYFQASLTGGSKITRGKPQFNYIQRDFELYGYFCGGNVTNGTDALSSIIDRVEFSTDTVTEVGSRMSYGQRELDAVYNKDYGFNAGGYNGSDVTGDTKVDRLDTTSETCSIVGTLPTGSRIGKATQTSSYGYWDKGESVSTNLTRFDFSTYSAQDSVNLPLEAYRTGGSFENQLYGYYAGTSGNTYVQRLDFITEGTALLPGTVYAPPKSAEGSGTQSLQFGYVMGAETPLYAGSNYAYTTFERMEFANETFVEIPTVHSSTGVKQGAATQNASTSWYIIGPNQGYVFKLDFDTDLSYVGSNTLRNRTSNPGGITGKSTLTQTTYNTVPESASYGYFGGGYNGGAASTGTSNIDRVDYETDTTSLPSAKIAFTGAPGGSIRGKFAGIESTQFGYILGGQAPTPTLSTIQKLDFISETLGVSDKNLSQVSRGGSAFKSKNYAYYGGSYINGAPLYTAPKTLERIDFDTETINVFGNISKGRTFTASTQSRDYGYVTGGNNYPPGLAENNIDKVDLSNENISQPIYQFSTPIVGHKIAQNQSNAYIFGGGVTFGSSTSYIRRLDFTDDSVVLTPARTQRGNTTAGEYTENSNYGYGSLGYSGPSPSTATFYSQVERFDFQTETSSSPGSNLSLSRFLGASFSGGSALRQVGKNNRNDSRAGLDNQGRNVGASYGYFIGGENNASYLTRNDRLDMLNETIIISTPAAAGGKYTCIEADSSTGYSMPGEGPGGNSNLFRFDFTNETFRDTATDFPANPTSNRPAVRSTNYAYFNQGASTVEKLDFTTDTFVDSQSHSLQPRASSFNASATSYGYIAGGNISDIERLDFSSENRTVLNVDLPSGIRYSGTSLNQNSTNNIYFVAGYNGTVRLSSIEKLDITTETSSASANNIGYYTQQSGSSQNENYGYIAGGVSSPTGGDFVAGGLSRVCRIELVNETASLPGTNLSQSRYGVDGMSNAQ